ncbi:hypothetical protein Tco_0379608 [Tanacetum coccineum]
MLKKSLRLITKPAPDVEMIGSSSRLQLTNPILEAHLDKEEKMEQAAREARHSKPELIKVVHEEAELIQSLFQARRMARTS